jgi:hypothetical protein
MGAMRYRPGAAVYASLAIAGRPLDKQAVAFAPNDRGYLRLVHFESRFLIRNNCTPPRLDSPPLQPGVEGQSEAIADQVKGPAGS